jgi:pyridoxine 4-dehydrogenase
MSLISRLSRKLTRNLHPFREEMTESRHSYSPIGRGILTGQIKSYNDIPEKDLRRMLPRFQPDVFENNMKLVKQLEAIAKKKSRTPVQLALSWLSAGW